MAGEARTGALDSLIGAAVLDGARLWGKLRELARQAARLEPMLARLATRMLRENEAEALEAEGAREGAEEVALLWSLRRRHRGLKAVNGIVENGSPWEAGLEWAVAIKHTALAAYALRWKATQEPAAAEGALAEALDRYAARLLEPEYAELYGEETQMLEEFFGGIERLGEAATRGRAALEEALPEIPPEGSLRRMLAILRGSEREVRRRLGAEAEMTRRCGISLAALFMEGAEMGLALRDVIAPTAAARLRLLTETSLVAAGAEHVVSLVERRRLAGGAPAMAIEGGAEAAGEGAPAMAIEGGAEAAGEGTLAVAGAGPLASADGGAAALLETLQVMANNETTEWKIIKALTVLISRLVRRAWKANARSADRAAARAIAIFDSN